jgi:hypothetical protein
MKTGSRDVSVGFTKRRFPAGTHMCFVYDSEAERRRVIAGYLAAGVEAGERVAYFADAGSEGAMRWMADAGVAATEIEDRGHVHVAEAEATYCPGGRFSPEVMFDTLRGFRAEGDEAGYEGARVSGEMSWALRDIPGHERLLEYEAKVTDVLAECEVTAICQYDAAAWDGATLLHVLRVHPMMVVRGQVVENPFFMQPEDYLRAYIDVH